MRQREVSRPKRASLSVRFAANDLADLQFMALCLGGLFFKRVLTDIALEIIGLVQTGTFVLDPEKLLGKIRANTDAQAACKRLHERGIRTLPNAVTVPTWIPLETEERSLVLRVSQQTRWSAAQVILEAIYAGIALASADHALVTLPSFIRVYRSVMVFEPGMAELVQDQINTALGFLPQSGPSYETDALPSITTWLKLQGATKTVVLTGRNDEGFDLIATFPAGPFDHNVGIWVIKNSAMDNLRGIDRLLRSSREKKLSSVWVIYFGALSSELTADLKAKFFDSQIEIVFINGRKLPQSRSAVTSKSPHFEPLSSEELT